MTDQDDELKHMVLEAVSNDFEEFETVVRDVQGWAPPDIDVPTAESIERAIMDAIADGEIKAYTLSSTPPHFVPAAAIPEVLRSLWFHATEKGKECIRKADSTG
jgi:hypothetical protein